MFTSPRLDTPVSAVALTLAATARDGSLVVCIGAGVSVAMDAGLPTGQRLAEMLDERLRGRLEGYVSPENVRDLIAVADAAVVPAGGEEALKLEVLELALFERATPNHGHQALALLLAEGAMTVLTWNWDTCIERAAPDEEQLRVAKTQADMQLRRPQVAKVHGCATMPATLLITSAQLAKPPVWAAQAFRDRLHGSTTVFIGIGDVADYARRRIVEFIDEFGAPDVRVVSRSIRSNWDESVWASLVPDLDDERRIEQTADAFLEEVARAWAGELLQRVGATCNSLTELGPVVRRVIGALAGLSSLDAIRWCRRAVMRPVTGESAVLSQGLADALVAIAVLAARRSGEVLAPRAACCVLGGDAIEILVLRETTPASEIQREGARRLEQLVSRNQLVDEGATFLVAGSVLGRFEDSEEASLEMVSGGARPTDVIDGPMARRATFLKATDLLAEAA